MKFFARSVISPLYKRPQPTTFGRTVARCAIIGALGFAASMPCAFAAPTSAVVSQQSAASEGHYTSGNSSATKSGAAKTSTIAGNDKAVDKDRTSDKTEKSSKDSNAADISTSERAAADAAPTTQITPKRKLLAVGISSMDDDNNLPWVAYPDNQWCYKNPDGSWAYNKWVQDLDGWHYIDEHGYAARGWYKMPNGKWFWFSDSNHNAAHMGDTLLNGYHYYIDESKGLLYDAWLKDNSGNWMRTDKWGIISTGWYYTPNHKWFYFDPQTNIAQFGIVKLNGYNYYIDENKGLLYNAWLRGSTGNWQRTDQWGIMASGWLKLPNTKWFYFDPITFDAQFGKVTVDGKDYIIDESLGLYMSCTTTYNGTTYLCNHSGEATERDIFSSNSNSSFSPSSSSSVNYIYDMPNVYVDSLIRVASREIGYYAPDDPEPGSKYGRWMAKQTGEEWLAGPSENVWWCAIFVSWCFNQAGINWSALPSYNCDQILARARSANSARELSSFSETRAGDVVLYDFNHDGGCDHIGIVVYNDGHELTTIEGNTSSGEAGSQHAGNGVYRRTRQYDVVRAILRPNALA